MNLRTMFAPVALAALFSSSCATASHEASEGREDVAIQETTLIGDPIETPYTNPLMDKAILATLSALNANANEL